MKYEYFAVASGKIHEASLGIESPSVHTLADWRSEHNFAVVGVQHRKVVAAAADEQTAILHVHRKTRRSGARSQGPAIFHLHCVYINVKRLVVLFQVDIQIAPTVRHRELRTTAEIDG